MLILTRRPGDSIVIDGGIRIIVLECSGRGVRIGIEAPQEVHIVRGEIAGQPIGKPRPAPVERHPQLTIASGAKRAQALD
ncbi:MAG: carbon storage regulator [Gemmatimonadaceae bacterium]